MRRTRGVDVTCETCPHYLVLTEEDMERLGAVAKCAPPIARRIGAASARAAAFARGTSHHRLAIIPRRRWR